MAPQQDGIRNGESHPPLTPSKQEAARLKALFQSVEPLEITGIDLTGKTPQEIARMLPRFTTLQLRKENPACGILVDVSTGRAFALRSGFTPESEGVFNGIRFKKGTMTQETANEAGTVWRRLGAHVEGQAAAFMRKREMREAVLYINASTPCQLDGRGCLFKLPDLLSEGAGLTVYNKNGRPFPFMGNPD